MKNLVRKKPELRFKQIEVGQYRTKDGPLSFVPLGLSTDGKVYKFLLETGWTLLEDTARSAREELIGFEKLIGFDEEFR